MLPASEQLEHNYSRCEIVNLPGVETLCLDLLWSHVNQSADLSLQTLKSLGIEFS